MISTSLPIRASYLAIALSALYVSPALAQDPAVAQPRAEASTPTTGPATDDIVVTARRVGESIQATPVSITAFTPDTLRSANIRSTYDLMIKTPGVYFSGSGGRENSTYQIRGQSKARSGFMSPAVVSYFADVPMPFFGSGVETFDLQSVQVLKGPQGTLFGRNTMAGAVLFYPVLPKYELDGYVEATYGNFDTKILEGAVTIPIVDQMIAVRLAGRYEKNDGYT